MLRVEYGKVYDVVIGKRECKGIYLGEFNAFRKNRTYKGIILLDLPRKDRISNISLRQDEFHLRSFNDYRNLSTGKLQLGHSVPLKMPLFQKPYYRDLLEEKLE